MSASRRERVNAWARSWWVTFRYGSVFTRAGRNLRRNLRDDIDAYVEVHAPPGVEIAIDCQVAGCRWGMYGCDGCECR